MVESQGTCGYSLGCPLKWGHAGTCSVLCSKTIGCVLLHAHEGSCTVVEHSKATTTNPKDLAGAAKVSITKLPPVAVLHGAHAMMDGAKKYGPYNWRDKDVKASIYVDAAMRHLCAWFDGEERAADSGVHHLGHAIACCAILLDALEAGKLVDDRPVLDETLRGLFSRVMEKLHSQVKERTK